MSASQAPKIGLPEATSETAVATIIGENYSLPADSAPPHALEYYKTEEFRKFIIKSCAPEQNEWRPRWENNLLYLTYGDECLACLCSGCAQHVLLKVEFHSDCTATVTDQSPHMSQDSCCEAENGRKLGNEKVIVFQKAMRQWRHNGPAGIQDETTIASTIPQAPLVQEYMERNNDTESPEFSTEYCSDPNFRDAFEKIFSPPRYRNTRRIKWENHTNSCLIESGDYCATACLGICTEPDSKILIHFHDDGTATAENLSEVHLSDDYGCIADEQKQQYNKTVEDINEFMRNWRNEDNNIGRMGFQVAPVAEEILQQTYPSL
mmetsp:Transcript_4666/g.5400  ORF Transcript_4666/g.5400 Transcript_4666/m.5400 type:complete len:321 (-) Transcript_4666:2121-3083(-)